ncbi:hypothetical protein CYMTET_49619 [Cymbomonas tetramitiformis]|uniref:Uncharacterized protein n=1 Tax=Cymbomonas tetramitiformis TaxID=36881 RepID=A0AAE0EUD3_9CHLO|nr:hypothetical protein CYMTET_49619 [Cymbomonas tetramitiformis]
MIPTGFYARDSFSRITWRRTDSVSDRDGRRALLDLIKGRVPPGVRQTLQEEHSQLRCPARVGPRPFRWRGKQRRVRDNRSEDWPPTEMPRKYKLFERLDPDFYAAAGPSVAGAAYSGVDERFIEVLGLLTTRLEKIEAAIKFQKAGAEAMRTLTLCQIFQVAADDGSEAFAAAVAEYGALAVLAGGESDEIDVSAYGFTPDSGNGVLSELEALTGQVVPRGGGASAGGALATGGYMGQFCVPTEEFPGGVDMVLASVVLREAACSLPMRGQRLCPRRTNGDRRDITPQTTTLAGGLGILGRRARRWWYLFSDRGKLFSGRGGTVLRHRRRTHHRLRIMSRMEEVVQPFLNGNRQSTRDGLYTDGSYGMDLTAPLHRAGGDNIADIFTQPLPPRAVLLRT